MLPSAFLPWASRLDLGGKQRRQSYSQAKRKMDGPQV